MASVMVGIVAIAWSVSADREERTKFPEPGRFYPSRKWVHHLGLLQKVWKLTSVRSWSRQIIEHEREAKGA